MLSKQLLFDYFVLLKPLKCRYYLSLSVDKKIRIILTKKYMINTRTRKNFFKDFRVLIFVLPNASWNEKVGAKS